MPRKLIIIPNEDKDKGNWYESWKKPKKRSLGAFPHPFRAMFLGGVGRGKTNTMKNILLEHQKLNKKFKRLYILTCDVSSKEWKDCDPDAILDQIPNIDLFNPKEKTLLVIDDFEWNGCHKDDMKNLSTIMRFVSSHRNVSVMLSYQSFFDAPAIARKCANVFIVYRPNSKQELTTIANRVGIDKDYFKKLFKKTKPYDSICIDHTVGSPAKIRKNIYNVIPDPDYSDSESDAELE